MLKREIVFKIWYASIFNKENIILKPLYEIKY